MLFEAKALLKLQDYGLNYILMCAIKVKGESSILITYSFSKSKGVPRQAEVAQGVPGRLRPRIFLKFRHYKGGWSSAIRTSRLYRRRNPWYSLSEAESTSGHMVPSGGATEKIPSDTTGNRSRDRPTSSAKP